MLSMNKLRLREGNIRLVSMNSWSHCHPNLDVSEGMRLALPFRRVGFLSQSYRSS